MRQWARCDASTCGHAVSFVSGAGLLTAAGPIGDRCCRRRSNPRPGPSGCGLVVEGREHMLFSPGVNWGFSGSLALMARTAANSGPTMRRIAGWWTGKERLQRVRGLP
jgi:hypothetical protein